MDPSTNYSENQTNATTSHDYLGVLFRQKPVILITMVTVLLTVLLGLILKTPVYEAQVKMLVSAEKMIQSPNYRDLSDYRNVEESLTQSEIVTSTPVLKRVIQAISLDQRPMDYEKRYASPLKGGLIDLMVNFKKSKLERRSLKEQQSIIILGTLENLRKRVKVEPIRDTDMFTISVEDYDPISAAVTANVLARSYVIFDLEQQLADLSLKYGDKESNVLQLKDNINKMIDNLNGHLLSNIEAIGPATIKIIEQADVPIEPKGPRKLVILILGFVMSIFLAVMLAFFSEYVDPTFKSPRQIEDELNLPFLGSIPRRKVGEELLIQADKKKTRYTHFYQILCDQLYLLMKDNNLKSILVTAAGTREGTSTVITNLGLYLSGSANRSVLLLDANFHGASLHKLLKVENTAGFAELIEGRVTFKDVIKEVGKNLYLVTAGQTELNPVILLNSPKVKEMLEEAKKKFEVILIDCPNIMGFKESIALAQHTDATVIVVSEDITRRQVVKIAIQSLWAKKVNLLGVVLNNRTFPMPEFIYERV